MQRKFIAVSICLAMLLANTIPFVTKVSAATTKLYLDPSSIIDEGMTYTLGTSFNLTVRVSDVIDLFAYEYKAYYDRAVLNCTKATRPAGHFLEPQVDPGNQFIPKWEIKNDFNATHGRIWLGFTLLAPEAARSGSGILTIITFSVVGFGATTIPMKDTKLADGSGNSITHEAGGSYFRNIPIIPPPAATIYVNPADITDPALVPSNNFTIDINILNATDVYSFDFKLSFDPTIVEGLETVEGTFLSSVGPTTILNSQIDNTAGFIWFTVTLLAPPGATGDGTLATITFHVIDLGATDLVLYGTGLADSEAQSLAHTTTNGRFANVIFARLFVNPPEIINPAIVPGYLFYLYIDVENVQNLFGYEFHLGYNTAVLTCIGVEVHPVQDEKNFMTRFSVDDWIGDVFVNVTYLPGANPISTSSPLTLVTLLFMVDNMGISELPLHDTKLINPSGDPIPHETGDGYFQSVVRDVAILYIIPSKTTFYEGRPINVTVVVQNQGDYFSETFDVTLFYDTAPIATQTVHDLPVGNSAELLFTWNTVGLLPCVNYTLNAKATAVPYEMDLADNTLTYAGNIRIKIMGDVNGDGTVDIFDLVGIALAFASSPGDSNWNPEGDLNEDGTIDIFDIVIIAANYNRVC